MRSRYPGGHQNAWTSSGIPSIMPSDISPTFTPPKAFEHPLVRDLCWVLSPSFDLLTDLPPYRRFLPPQQAHVLLDWLHQLERYPQPLEDFMAAQAYRRLGHHFEQLVLFYLSHAPETPFRVLDHNRPVYTLNAQGHRVTKGEVDSLLADGGRTVHLEVAVKFYLGVADKEHVHWLGPGLEDRLDLKLSHLREHQLPLSCDFDTPTGSSIERRFWVKGVLFHPWPRQLTLHTGLNDVPPTHFWLTCSQAIVALTQDPHWTWLPRQRWLGCGWQDRSDITATEALLTEQVNERNRVVMLWNEASGSRRMVVPDSWPAAASRAIPAPDRD